MKKLLVFGMGLGIFVVSTEAIATCPGSACDPTSRFYYVRQDCSGLSNCFQSVSELSGKDGSCTIIKVDPALPFGTLQGTSALCSTNGWLWSVRKPTADDRVTIDVGPGVFETFVCPVPSVRAPLPSPPPNTPPPTPPPAPRNGHVTIRGQGPAVSRFRGSGSFSTGMDIFGCDDLLVTQLAAEGNNYGVRWLGGGEGTWSRVDMIANRALSPNNALAGGWADSCYDTNPQLFIGDTEPSTQRIFDSRAIATGPSALVGYAYVSDCAESYFFGGQLVNTMSGSGNVLGGLGMGRFASFAVAPPRFFAFGTQILIDATNMRNNTVAVALDAGNIPTSFGPGPGEVHGHDITLHVHAGVASGASGVSAIGLRIQNGVKLFVGGPLSLGDIHSDNGPAIPFQN